MKSKVLFPLFLTVLATALTSGCATHHTRNGKHTRVLGGLVDITTKSYQPENPVSITTNTNAITGNDVPTGKTVKVFWGLFNFTDY